jgi:hypothetical protein
MKRERLHLSNHQNIETGLDWNGRFYIAYSSGASLFFRDVPVMRRWLKLPKGIPSRESFDSWIASLEAADQQRAFNKAGVVQGTAPSLSQELLETGFGPEVFAEDEDPTANTKMVT